MLKKLSLYVMASFYLLAGINHFLNPAAYLSIIPTYFPNPDFINYASGVLEILLALLLFIPSTRKIACYGIIILLIAFIPAHIFMFETGWCIRGYCLSEWMIWARLLILQPLLIWWAWSLSRKNKSTPKDAFINQH